MAWAFQSIGSIVFDADSSGSGGGITVTNPSGLTAGDLVVLGVSLRYGNTQTWGTPSGWTVLKTQGNIGTEMVLYGRIADSGLVSAGSVNLTTGGSGAGCGGVMGRYTGGTTTVHASTGQDNGTSAPDVLTPALTITNANTLVVYFGSLNWLDGNSGVNSYPNSVTSRAIAGSAFGSNEMSVFYGDRIETTAASMSSGSIDLVSTSSLRSLVIIASLDTASGGSGMKGAQYLLGAAS